MISLSETVTLDDQEDLVEIFRIAKGTMIRFLCIDSIIVIILFFFMTPLFRLGPWGVGFFLSVLTICGFMGWRAVIKWMGSVCIATTARIIVIERTGFWKKAVKDVAYKEIVHGQYVKKGIIDTVRNVGSVQCVLKSSASPFTIERIVGPQRLLEIIGKHTTFADIPIRREDDSVRTPETLPHLSFSHQNIPNIPVPPPAFHNTINEEKKTPIASSDDYWGSIQS